MTPPRERKREEGPPAATSMAMLGEHYLSSKTPQEPCESPSLHSTSSRYAGRPSTMIPSRKRKREENPPGTFPATSMTMLGEHYLSNDASQEPCESPSLSFTSSRYAGRPSTMIPPCKRKREESPPSATSMAMLGEHYLSNDASQEPCESPSLHSTFSRYAGRPSTMIPPCKRKREESRPAMSPATSMDMLGEHHLSRDTSRDLTCLVEGESSLFSVVVRGGMNILLFKNCVLEQALTIFEGTISTRNLQFLKVSYILEPHKRCNSLGYALSGRRGPQIS